MPYKDPEKRKAYHAEYNKKWNAEPEHKQYRRKEALARRNRDPVKAREEFRRWYWERGGKEHQQRRFADPEVARTRNLRAKYRLSRSDYFVMLAEQGGACAICRVRPEDLKGELHVDHDHRTGKVRGLLCGPCNRGLAMFRDNSDSILAAAAYLRKAA